MTTAEQSLPSGGETSVDPAEAAFFGRLAADWWNPDGSSAMLHKINPLRLGYIRDAACRHFRRDGRDRMMLSGLRALDIGCGAGLLTEPLARMGASVLGLDAARENIMAAQNHAAQMHLDIDYRTGSAEALAAHGERFDLITSLEVIEHVADRTAFLQAITTMLAPGGLVILSTPNRTTKSYAVLIVGAERLLRTIPKGAHDWDKFVTPQELTAELADVGLSVCDTTGLSWQPGRGFTLGTDTGVDYFLTAKAV